MFDRDTMIVSYDPQRGDPRGSRSRKAEPRSLGLGDCIDCGLCVQVCPTGIDIRDGLQYQCINCAACVDVCDGVMDKMAYPRGLIRFATQNGLLHRWSRATVWRRAFRPRVLVYDGVVAMIATAFVASMALRSPFKLDVVRDRGTLARLLAGGRIENVYRLQLMNGIERAQRYRVRVEGLDGATLGTPDEIVLGSSEARWLPASVQVPHDTAERLGGGAHPLRFHVERLEDGDDAAASVREKSNFVVPR